MEEADRLARKGKYGEAVHVLLLHCLDDLRLRLDIALAPSLTSREILERLHLTEGAKSALARIVTMAELNHFGGRAASEAAYQACRENYRRLATERSEAV